MTPDLESLRCFVAAASQPSFRAAARRVHLSPAAFSGRIQRLEDLLQARLFERSTRRVVLTPAGQRLLEHARRCLHEADRCVAAVRDDDAPMPFDLCVGTRYELGLSWLLPALEALSAGRPERHIHLRFGDASELIRATRAGEVDAVVASVRLTESGLAYGLVHPEAYLFVGAPEHLADQPIRGPEDAGRHALVDVHADLPLFRYFLDARPPGDTWAFSRVERMGTIAAVRHRVLAGVGVAVLPAYFVREDVEAGRLGVICPETELRSDFFRLIWREDHPRAADLADLAETLSTFPLR